MVCGFATWVGLEINETLTNGCFTWPGSSTDCNRPILEDEILSDKLATVARYDLNGNMIWCKAYVRAEEGAIAITPSTDGGFVFTGWGAASRTINGDPIYFNPDGTNFNTPDGMGLCDFLTPKMLVGKINANGDLLWLNSYAYTNFGEGYSDALVVSQNAIGYDVIETTADNYRVVGRCQDLEDGGDTKIFAIDLNSDGYIVDPLNDRALFGQSGYKAEAREITKNSTGYYITGFEQKNDGSNSNAILFKINDNMSRLSFANDSWDDGTAAVREGVNGNAIGWDVKSLADDKIAWAFIENCNNCLSGANNIGEGKIFIYESAPPHAPLSFIDLQSINTYGFSKVHAWDMKMGLTSTKDGGFAVMTGFQTQQVLPDQSPYKEVIDNLNSQFPNTDCSPTVNYWETDAYVAKFDQNGNFLWDQSFDADPAPIQNYPGDWKEQECVYRITEADDGSLVFVGNTSHNKDDYYIAKIASDCCLRKYLDDDYDIRPNLQGEVLEISSDMTWNPGAFGGQTVVTAVGRIIVKDGATLTINGGLTIEFADSRKMPFETKLIVEPGGTLILNNNVTLTSLSDCDNTMWSGVEVWGTKTQEQLPQYQGQLFMSSSTIENAIIGVAAVKRVGFQQDLLKTGGIVKIHNSTFRNNLIGVEMRPYNNGPQSGVDNKSIITRTNFIIDAPLNDPNIAATTQIINASNGTRETVPRAHQEFILLDGITGINILGNSFKLDNSNSYISGISEHWRGYGILSWDSDFNLNSYKTTINDPNPIPNRLENLWVGAYCLPLGNMNDVVINDNVFINNYVGVGLTGTATFTRVTNNTFEVDPRDGFPIERANVAIWSKGATGLKIENNEILGLNDPSRPGSNAGIYIASSAEGGGSAEIYRNEFDYLSVGTQSDFNNSLLEVDCNDFKNSNDETVINWHNTTSGNITDQGDCPTVPDPEAPAANEFLGDYSDPNSFHILNEGGGFGYNHYDIPEYEPAVSTSLGLASCTFFDMINESEACPARNAPPDFPVVESVINDLVAELDELNGIIDGAITDELIEFINITEEGQLLKHKLEPYTPYLSDEVLITLINKNGVPEWVLREILPKMEILSTAALTALINSPNDFSNGLIKDMVEMSSPVDESVLIACINRDKQLPDWVIKDLLLLNTPLRDLTLIAALNKPKPLANHAVKDVLAQNTPLSPEVDAVFQANNYPNWVYNEVYSSTVIAGDPDDKIIPLSPRDELEREILYKTKLLSREVTWVVSFYLDDNDFEPAALLLEELNTVEGSCLLLPLLLETKDGQRLYNHIQRIRQNADTEPDPDRSERLYAFCDYYELMFEIRTQAGGLEAITQDQLNKVLELSELGVAISTNNRNLLAYLELRELDQLLLAPINFGGQKAPLGNVSAEHEQLPETVQPIDFILYPNPTTNEVRLRYDINDLSERSTITIYDISGKILYQTTVYDQHNELVLRINEYDKGIYMVNITSSNGDSQTKKLIIQ